MTESDNIEQAVDGAFRSAVTQAAALGRMVAQLREQAMQRAARQEEATSRELQRRYDAERHYARVMLSQADHDGWWNTATTSQVASVVATAQAWKERDPEIARLASRVDDRAQARWGINPSARIASLSPAQRHQEAQQLSTILALDELDPNDPLHTLVEDMNRLEYDAVDEAPEQDQQPGQEHAEADVDSKSTSAEATQTETGPAAERDAPASRTTREQTLDEFEQLLRSNGMDEQAIETHMLPERANAKAATEAVNVKSPTKARPAKNANLSQSRQRDTERGR